VYAYAIVPSPIPLPPEVIESHSPPLVTVASHAQVPLGVVIATVPEPASAVTDAVAGSTVSAEAQFEWPCCVTVTATGVAEPLENVIVPVRLVAERFSLATKVNDPLAPVPDAPASASHAESLTADQLQVAPAVVTSIWTGLLVPAAATVVLPGTAAWAKTELHTTAAAS